MATGVAGKQVKEEMQMMAMTTGVVGEQQQ
jgi:hypothetical protein